MRSGIFTIIQAGKMDLDTLLKRLVEMREKHGNLPVFLNGEPDAHEKPLNGVEFRDHEIIRMEGVQAWPDRIYLKEEAWH